MKVNDLESLNGEEDLVEVREGNHLKEEEKFKNGGMGNSKTKFSHFIIFLRPVMPGQ